MTDTPSGSVRLDPNIIAAEVSGGRIAENIIHFARVLRAAGLPVGPERTVLATRAVLAAGISSPKVLYWTLHSVFVSRRSERELFNQAFLMFWKDPDVLKQIMSLLLPGAPAEAAAPPSAMSRRLAESLFKTTAHPPGAEQKIELDATGTFSDLEVVRNKDFEQMSAAELIAARRLIADLRLPFEAIRTRRFEPAAQGARIDMRRILRRMAAHGSDDLRPLFKRRRWRRTPVVVLCDISGSMDAYARMVLHFIHALTNDRRRVDTFLFGTRLTPVTRALKYKDPDVALAKVSRDVKDWSGGTRIGHCLEDFNKNWGRRVLGQNALVLLFTDGLDRDGGTGLDLAVRRLAASCRRLVWLNPLLRFERYAPLAAGARALSRHVSETRPCHNLDSLASLARALRT